MRPISCRPLQRGMPAAEPAMTAEEREASNLIVQSVAGAGGGGRGGGGGAGGGRGGGAGAAGAARRWRGWPARRVRARRGAAGAAARVLPARRPAAAGGRRRGGGGGGGRGGGGAAGPSLPQEMNAEFSILLGKNMTALEIRDFLCGEFTPVPLADVMAVLRAREAAGRIKLVPKTAK